MIYLSEARDISKGNFSETIEDYRGYKIQIARYLNKQFIKDGVYTYNLEQWRLILQGKDGCPVNFKNFPMEDQLTALGAVETAILKEYYSIPVFSRYSASLMGYKVDYISYEYNTFMGYGGIRYMTFNYDDTAWAEFVASNNNILNYK